MHSYARCRFIFLQRRSGGIGRSKACIAGGGIISKDRRRCTHHHARRNITSAAHHDDGRRVFSYACGAPPKIYTGPFIGGLCRSSAFLDCSNMSTPVQSLLQSRCLSSKRPSDPDTRNCQTIEELVQMAHEHLPAMSPRGIAAFWTLASKFMNTKKRSDDQKMQNQVGNQLEMILVHTLEEIRTFGWRDLAQTTFGIAKIAKNVDGGNRRFPKDSPHQILHDMMIGNNSVKKHFIFGCMAEASRPILAEFRARELSNLIYAFGLAEHNHVYQDGITAFDVFAVEAISKLEDFNSFDLSNTVWAYATLEISHPLLFKKVAGHIVALDNLETFWPQALSNVVWAYATAKEPHPKLFRKVADHIVALDSLETFWPQALSNTVWAFAFLGEPQPELFETVADHIFAHDNLRAFAPQALSNILLAYATAKHPHPKLFKKVADHIVTLDNLRAFAPQALSNTVWAYATAKESNPKLFKKVADHIVALDKLRAFAPQALSNILLAYATAKESHPKFFKKVADHIVGLDNLRPFDAQALANIVWAYATAKESHPKLFKKLSNHIVALDNLRAFKAQALSNTVWAYATAKEPHPKLFKKVAEAAIKRQNEFKPQEVANFLLANATTGQTNKHLFGSFAQTVTALIGECNSQDLANIAWAYAVANVTAPSLFNDEFISACLDKEDEFTVGGLSQLHQWNLWQEELKSDIRLPPPLQEKCYDAFVSQMVRPSAFQNDVICQLISIGLHPDEEVLTKSGYRLDAVVEVNGKRIGIEVDGPTHFLNRQPTGSTILKHRQVTNLDEVEVVSVPYWEWEKPGNGSDKKQRYLRGLLGLS